HRHGGDRRDHPALECPDRPVPDHRSRKPGRSSPRLRTRWRANRLGELEWARELLGRGSGTPARLDREQQGEHHVTGIHPRRADTRLGKLGRWAYALRPEETQSAADSSCPVRPYLVPGILSRRRDAHHGWDRGLRAALESVADQGMRGIARIAPGTNVKKKESL